jgi:uncharacterized integral membrane protein
MIALIILLVFGIGVSIFALQNTIITTVNFFGLTFGSIPLYTVILGSMLFGVIAASIIGLIDSLGHAFNLSRKDRQIASVNSDVATLQKRVSELEDENAVLRQDKKEIVVEKNAEIERKDEEVRAVKPTFIDTVRRNFR